ncbi:MAG: hypothetical protein RMY31_024495 [Dendronalium sp. ChiSLP03b]
MFHAERSLSGGFCRSPLALPQPSKLRWARRRREEKFRSQLCGGFPDLSKLVWTLDAFGRQQELYFLPSASSKNCLSSVINFVEVLTKISQRTITERKI